MREGLTLAWFNPHGTVERMPLHFIVLCRHITTLIRNGCDYFALLIVSSEDMLNFNTIEINAIPLFAEVYFSSRIII
ncbi:hypothetical protein [Escherichia coli]|uniref:hypothetical protein n=1 Tax=Escherichia coli TaxID=562 RepID=UPI00388FB305